MHSVYQSFGIALFGIALNANLAGYTTAAVLNRFASHSRVSRTQVSSVRFHLLPINILQRDFIFHCITQDNFTLLVGTLAFSLQWSSTVQIAAKSYQVDPRSSADGQISEPIAERSESISCQQAATNSSHQEFQVSHL